MTQANTRIRTLRRHRPPRHFRFVAAIAAALAVSASGATADPLVTITSPTEGTVVSRSTQPRFTITGTVAFEEAVKKQESRRFFLRLDDCAYSSTRLSPVAGTGETGEQCHAVGGYNHWGEVMPLVGSDTWTLKFPTEGGTPLTFDASRPVTGTIVMRSCGNGPAQPLPTYCPAQNSPVGLGAGNARLDVTLFGERVQGRDQIGQTTIEYVVTPDRSRYEVQYSIAPASEFDKRDYTNVTLHVQPRGAAVNHGRIGFNGASFVDIPVWTPSSAVGIQVAVGSKDTLSSAGVTLNPDGTWTAERTTPQAGERLIFARGFQGDVTTDVTTQIQVVP